MRFRVGGIPLSPDFDPVEPWKPLREPNVWLAQLYAIPIGFAVSILVAVLWLALTPLGATTIRFNPALALLAIVGNVVVHELIHAAIHPMQGRSSRTYLGVWPLGLVFYAHYDGELSRRRFVAILIAPFIAISLVPLFLATILQTVFFWVAAVSIFNALLSCMDILGAVMILLQVPRDAIARNQGWRTYWRERESGIPIVAEQNG